MKSFPQAAAREAAGALLVKIRERYGESMEVNIYDPRCCFWFFDLIRFNIRAEPTWILDGKLLWRGIPSWDELREKIDGSR
ncbi:hypothetical protein [Aminivibrio sp.]|jgi:hypothetical protein|uniref:hypothetical protein n=1 Tax=Aminivibrio sp. TaxID=1872489 RepID=UPI001A632FF6|nr:hypothetical protein [Aminivibrio sp.]MBL3540225.1 hypothetical protein [Aminivibrio sp.]